MRLRYTFIAVGLSLVLLTSGRSVASGKPLSELMHYLNHHMERIEGAIRDERYATVAEAADAIAQHPEPSLLQRLEILAGLGTGVRRFMAADEAMKTAALALKEAAEERHMLPVVTRFRTLEQRCIDCHRWAWEGTGVGDPATDEMKLR